MADQIGLRVAARIAEVFPDRRQKDLASEVGMTPDAFSRALGGHRAFSSIELARVAELLDTDLYWLITGEPDPKRLVVAARHDFNFASGARGVPGEVADRQLLEDVGLAYRQAYQDVEIAPSRLPSDVDAVRAALGPHFIRPFIDRLEARLGIDVVRIAGLSTSYCLSIGGRQIIVTAATGNWFWENWSIAHELAHLIFGHLVDGRSPHDTADQEAAANAFAAELLMPADRLRSVDWASMGPAELAALVWDWGISTDALVRRLRGLGIGTTPDVRASLGQTTQRLLRHHWDGAQGIDDEITMRMDGAATRRFPVSLQEAHVKLIAQGGLGKGTLAWMLGILPEQLEVDAPPTPLGPSADELGAELGLWA